MSLRLSAFAAGLRVESAFDVLAVAKRLKASGKDVVELQIGDSPFPTPKHALDAGIAALRDGATHYGPSLGLTEFRETVARTYTAEFGVKVGPENVVVASGAKPFEQFFCEAVLDPGDEVLLFTPHFPTYEPNIQRRGARARLAPLRADRHFRPDPAEVARFLAESPRPRAIFLNSPHNPTGGVTTAEDLKAIADFVRGRGVAILSDEPYCHMAWADRHRTILSEPGMLEVTLAAYTFSKSYSMSGWRLGYAIASPEMVQAVGKMVNTTASCTPPFVQLAGQAALEHDAAERDEVMDLFRRKVARLVAGLSRIDGVRVEMPAGTFYVFADVSAACRRLGVRSHGLAMFLLEGADDRFGVACLGGECFGEAGSGFLRFSCAEPDERLDAAVAFLGEALTRRDRLATFLAERPHFRAG
jgi:aspartate aminotransferase